MASVDPAFYDSKAGWIRDCSTFEKGLGDDAQVAYVLEGRYQDADTANPYDPHKVVTELWGWFHTPGRV